MLYAGAYSQEVQVWRKTKADTWGNLPGNKKPPIPALYGFSLSHTIEEATIAPRTTEVIKASPNNAKRNFTGLTMFCSVYEDVMSDDLIVWEDSLGRIQVAEVEGEGYNDYISPYSGMEAGKEIFLGRVVHRR